MKLTGLKAKIKILQFHIGKTRRRHYALNNWMFIDNSHFYFDLTTIISNLSIEQNIKDTDANVY